MYSNYSNRFHACFSYSLLFALRRLGLLKKMRVNKYGQQNNNENDAQYGNTWLNEGTVLKTKEPVSE